MSILIHFKSDVKVKTEPFVGDDIKLIYCLSLNKIYEEN